MAVEQQQVDERALAVALFNQTWTLLDKAGRTEAEEDREIVAADLASLPIPPTS